MQNLNYKISITMNPKLIGDKNIPDKDIYYGIQSSADRFALNRSLPANQRYCILSRLLKSLICLGVNMASGCGLWNVIGIPSLPSGGSNLTLDPAVLGLTPKPISSIALTKASHFIVPFPLEVSLSVRSILCIISCDFFGCLRIGPGLDFRLWLTEILGADV